MPKKNWLKGLSLSIHTPNTGVTLMLLALTQLPVAIKNAAEVACIGQTSNYIWQKENNHSEANMLAVQRCNGGT